MNENKTENGNDIEIWKPIIGFEGLYDISNHGKVKNVKRNRLRTLSYDRYFSVALYKENKFKMMLVHRLVALHFIPLKDNKPQVNHIDANKHNNHHSNLEWVDAFENIQHAVKNDLIGNFTKISVINKAISMLENGKTRREISKELGVKYLTLCVILRRNKK